MTKIKLVYLNPIKIKEKNTFGSFAKLAIETEEGIKNVFLKVMPETETTIYNFYKFFEVENQNKEEEIGGYLKEEIQKFLKEYTSGNYLNMTVYTEYSQKKGWVQ